MAFAHQAFELDLLGSMDDPQAVAPIAQRTLEQFDRLDHNDRLSRSGGEGLNRPGDVWVNDVLQLDQGLRIVEDHVPQFLSIDFTFTIQDPLAETIHHRLIAWGTLRNCTMGERVRVDGIRPSMPR